MTRKVPDPLLCGWSVRSPSPTELGKVFREGVIMKKILAVLFFVFAVIVTLSLCTAVVQNAYADPILDCTGCPGLGNALWWSSSPSSTNASSGNFSYTQTINWSLDDTRTAGNISYDSNPTYTYNVYNLTLTPTLFLPNSGHTDDDDDECCAGSLTVDTTGSLSDTGSNGSLRSKCYVAPNLPLTTYHTVTINH